MSKLFRDSLKASRGIISDLQFFAGRGMELKLCEVKTTDFIVSRFMD